MYYQQNGLPKEVKTYNSHLLKGKKFNSPQTPGGNIYNQVS